MQDYKGASELYQKALRLIDKHKLGAVRRRRLGGASSVALLSRSQHSLETTYAVPRLRSDSLDLLWRIVAAKDSPSH